jgi:YD repeat-containing protein
VSDEKTNMRKPLLTHRKEIDGIKTRVGWDPWDKGVAERHPLSQETACLSSWRCPAYRWRELVAGAGWNRRTCRLDAVGRSSWASSPAGRTREDRKRRQP